ncbi:MAG TPA: DUF6519 domain-containing protein, partial [Tahibacter sp.]|nr:DUF6519 domain-containing protein [Tahibacter sp.]
MKGDYSRIRFDAANRFSRVLEQQGRVALDADANERNEILLYYLRTLARDIFGDYGGPLAEGGFLLEFVDDKLMIGAGRYYVHGILCESDGTRHYLDQPDYEPALPNANGSGGDGLRAFLKSKTPNDQRYWAYLDVWERHVTALEDERLREVALGGPDTCARTQVVWQVKARAFDDIVESLLARQKALEKRIKEIEDAGGDASAEKARLERIDAAIEQLRRNPAEACAAPLEDFDPGTGGMSARLEKALQPKTPCIIAPDARYRGAENQLYRIEIHRGGAAGQATFKWSRDNGSVAALLLKNDGGSRLKVSDAGGFPAGSWVELSDTARELRGEPGVLVRIVHVEDDTLIVDADSVAAAKTVVVDPQRSTVRLWDQQGDDLDDGVALLATNPVDWLDLEDGLQVHFDPDGDYRSGDYWLIPARVAGGPEGGIEWPYGEVPQPARRSEHHYAPLGWIGWERPPAGQGFIKVDDCLCTLKPL